MSMVVTKTKEIITMDNSRYYVDFHVIQTVPPSCVNRDDTGRPKTATYGGVHRARVSSQAWKHAIRVMFKDIFASEKLGLRTKYVAKLIADKLIFSGMDPDEATKKSVNALKTAEITTSSKKEDMTGALFFISAMQVEKLAELILNDAVDKKTCKEALKNLPSIDIALFGRMVADDVNLNVDAACQVAHSISTHAIQDEYDYFTALDDYKQTDDAGAGHLGTMEFNSSTLYRYATVNVLDLFKSVGADTPDAVAGFAEAFVRSMPTGKQNSYANRTLPDLVYVTIREDQPVNLSGAFEEPVKSINGFAKKSCEKLFTYAEKIYADYSGKPKYSFVVGYDGANIGAEKMCINELLDRLAKIISEEVR